MATAFTLLSLHPQLVQTVAELGYTEPTPIQTSVIPLMLAGSDVIGQAQTGTGKTAAFALPILHRLIEHPAKMHSLVLVPTRELALQVAKAFQEYGKELRLSVLAVYGGQPYGPQISRLQRGVNVVVGTPGRLIDLLERKVLDLSAIQTVVLDEADEMLSMGFIEDIQTILNQTNAARQTALFSATLPPAIRSLANHYMRAPQSVTIQREQVTVAAIQQRYVLVNEADKLAALTRLFEVEPVASALIFVRTRLDSGTLANALTQRGFPAEALNGDLSQETREQVLDRFRNRQITVLVATDVAARGLDIDDISHVFNYQLPDDPEIYVHRVGRTGRAGKTGVAISIVSTRERGRLRQVEAFTRQKLTRTDLPSVEDIQKHREAQLMSQLDIWLQRGRCKRERELVEQLAQAGHDPLEIAAVALKIARAEEKQRPILPVSELPAERPSQTERARKPRTSQPFTPGKTGSHEAGMVRLALSKGRLHGVRTADVVSTLAYHADIPGRSIGKILIDDHQTLVDIPEEFTAQVLANAPKYRIRKQPILVDLA